METQQSKRLTSEESIELLNTLMGFLKDNRPYLVDIDQAVTNLNNGTLNVILRVHNNKVTDIAISTTERIVYK